jgi:site-specific DNA-adenine methylase
MTIDSYIKNIKNQDLKDKYNVLLERNNELENQVHQLLENQIFEETNKKSNN